MAKRKKRTYRRRRRTGLMGLPASRLNVQDELMDIVLIGAGVVAASKGAGMLDKAVNKTGTRIMGIIVPAVVTVAGIAGSLMFPGKAGSIGKGIALGGAVKLAEKVLNKENLLSGVDEPLMLPGIGSFGMASLPELAQYSEHPEASVTSTGGDPSYYMGQPTEMLSGDQDDLIAY